MPPHRQDSGPKTVLIVDDDPAFLRAVQEVVEQEGLRTLTARDGAEAFRLLESGETPCLILLDLRMPGMNGREFRERQVLDPRWAGIPVVGFSGASNGPNEATLLALSSFLRKPVHLHQLLETVEHYCSDPDHIERAADSSAVG